MRRILKILIISLTISSCSSALKVNPIETQYRDSKLSYFVENHGKDRRHLDQMIATELRHRGLNASSGNQSERPDDLDILVVYEDRWQWDMTNYLIHMRIDLRDPNTNVLLGTGSSYQTSLARDDPDEIIRNIIAGMFGSKISQ